MGANNYHARALALLAPGWPDASPMTLAQLPIGERDRRLLALREQLFGGDVAGVADCPDCSSSMQFDFRVADVTVAPQSMASNGKLELSLHDGYEITFHLPNSLDLTAIGEKPGFEDKEKLLLERLVDCALWNGVTVPAADLPREVVIALQTQLSEADPQGDIQLNFSCQACGRLWQCGFDIASFLWIEVHAWALRLMREVHSLAQAYGWREADILAMGAWRRQRYLELLSE